MQKQKLESKKQRLNAVIKKKHNLLIHNFLTGKRDQSMKEPQNRLKAKTLILTHGDSDGICSGAIAKTAYPDAYVYFTNPVSLLDELKPYRRCGDPYYLRYCNRRKTLLRADCTCLMNLQKNATFTILTTTLFRKTARKKSWFYHDVEACCFRADLQTL